MHWCTGDYCAPNAPGVSPKLSFIALIGRWAGAVSVVVSIVRTRRGVEVSMMSHIGGYWWIVLGLMLPLMRLLSLQSPTFAENMPLCRQKIEPIGMKCSCLPVNLHNPSLQRKHK